ncbi:hypothetical protein DSCW_10510 [Desulfosarcina widdelii]|uniref:Lipoprotein n=1 Tax=Desulfosarcina widdelii TaxID=947919 RepID=A0A5K7Z593_9BACT|nr:hypothetical protein [Desulfosarcina widdelii]BBO73634.1 hypothetical protein DSCW_10510 [Desulfosarcina widdelii]
MKAFAVILLSIFIAWTPCILPAAFGSEPEEKQPSSPGSVWQEVKEDWVEIGKGAKDAGVEVGKSIKKEFQELPENMRKGYQETKEALKGGTGGNSEGTSTNKDNNQQ